MISAIDRLLPAYVPSMKDKFRDTIQDQIQLIMDQSKTKQFQAIDFAGIGDILLSKGFIIGWFNHKTQQVVFLSRFPEGYNVLECIRRYNWFSCMFLTCEEFQDQFDVWLESVIDVLFATQPAQ